MKRIIFRWIILSLVAACTGEIKRQYFTSTLPTTTKPFDLDGGVYLKYPYRVRITDSTLYVSDLHADDFFCHEFDYPSLKYIQSFARRGKAPNHLTSMGNMIDDGNGNLFLLDVFARKIYLWNGQNACLHTELSVDMPMSLDFTMYNDSVFIFPDYSGEYRLIFMDRNGRIIRRTGSIPAAEHTRVPASALGQAWRSFIHYNQNNGICALVTQLGDVLEIYDLRNDRVSITECTGGEPKFRMNGTNVSHDGIMGYSDVYVGDRYIYALFWGHEISKIRQGTIKTEGGNLFRIFDFEGNPVRQYRLDYHVTGFCINEKTGTVVATDVNNEKLLSFSIQHHSAN